MVCSGAAADPLQPPGHKGLAALRQGSVDLLEAGVTDINVRLPRDVGVRVKVETGPHTVEAAGLTEDGDVYTNAAFGASEVTLEIDVAVGVGQINLEVED